MLPKGHTWFLKCSKSGTETEMRMQMMSIAAKVDTWLAFQSHLTKLNRLLIICWFLKKEGNPTWKQSRFFILIHKPTELCEWVKLCVWGKSNQRWVVSWKNFNKGEVYIRDVHKTNMNFPFCSLCLWTSVAFCIALRGGCINRGVKLYSSSVCIFVRAVKPQQACKLLL